MSNQQNSPQQISEQMMAQKIEESRKAIDECYDNAIVKHQNNRIPEEVFRAGFLGYFTGQPKEPNQSYMAQWIAIAGSPMSEVDVVDEADKVIFTVPPMMNTSSIALKTTRGESMNDLMRQYQHQKSITPYAGQNFAHAHFGQKARELTSVQTDSFDKAQEAWGKIFKHYGIPDPSKQEVVDPAAPVAQSASSDYDYD